MKNVCSGDEAADRRIYRNVSRNADSYEYGNLLPE